MAHPVWRCEWCNAWCSRLTDEAPPCRYCAREDHHRGKQPVYMWAAFRKTPEGIGDTRMSKHPDRKKVQAHRQHLRRSKKPKGFDGCPVSPIVHVVLSDCRGHGIPFGIISADRRDGIAQKFGHSSQLQLWNLYQEGKGLPANPPLTSTHEYRNGGTSKYGTGTPAYHTKFKVGATLPPWGLGLDFRSNDEATHMVSAAKDLGYHFFQPYNSGSELHHLCLAENPLPNLVKRNKA